MRIIKVILSIGFLLCFSSSFAQFSNMIVFGDSLSDNGNFPESSRIWKNPTAAKKINNTFAQFYVPFSNPVDTSKKQFSVPIFKNRFFLWPTLNNLYLAKQVPIEPTFSARQFRSISWSHLFLSMAFQDQLTRSSHVSPSDLIYARKIPNYFSFNYAWGYATSSQDCVNPFYVKIANCTATSIIRSKQQYLADPTNKNYRRIEIPGIAKQVALFIDDKNKNKVSVNQKTVYIFWIGGNDLIVANNALKNHYDPLPVLKFSFGITAWHTIQAIHTLLKSLPENQKPPVIYIFNLFNPALTPEFYQTTMGKLGNLCVCVYNFWLDVESTIFNLFSRTKTKVIPVYHWYQKSSKNDYFKKTMGKSCQLNNGDYENAVVIPKNNCAGFMFWNAVHPAMPMNAIVAYQFLLKLKK
ncbi:MAG: hypothetical protein COY58_07225 [Gammaproteobacteria bacterium CG_4_10_14_0_8_um_filter_38_16]|nr:MAG: hypothetical protein COY58_07225 [Gammaproteobacteria bacterium CG_4_10_14_0_8_um_filter_38_16]PJA04006.1 MAG: hypothetical protein COX72_02075 [Gammaproteobacteria bacterium CG_4_10_14_0_2_um_filter_38_22]PJB11018.1 MAG: hypothetical protein CO120_01850 [Gammaproteobacteria bacterium CG_4_9_14_3_um_filter_38_9]